MGNNIILETKFVADISGSFYIPSYQRGYRWSETEVVRLLDDIYQNGKKNYCLQPVVVRKKEDQYELIDGQQRLTTLYLIYKYMKNVNPFFNEPAFTLSYQTRDQSEEFLKTLDMTKQDDNIDFWFIAKAYNTIKEWFEQDLQIRVMHIFEWGSIWFMMMFTLSVKTIHMVFTEMMMIALRIPLLFLKMKRVLIRKIESLS